MTDPDILLLPRIGHQILVIRGQKVMVDADLAALYGVPTKALNQAVKRNSARFPSDFMFQLTDVEKSEVVTNCDHLAKLKFSKSLPFAFTEYGAVAIANVLASPQAVEMGIYVVRAFVRLRDIAGLHKDLAERLKELEEKTEALDARYDNFSQTTRVQLRQVFDALKELMTPPEPLKRPIGFVPLEDKSKNLTREGMADVDENRFIDHEAVLAWSSSLNTANPLVAPQVHPKT
jgi:predicted transcriptional regulator